MIPATLANNPSLARWARFLPDRTVRVAFGKVEYGQGAITALTQIAAEELDVPLDIVVTANAATDAVPDEGMTVGSMSIESSGASVRAACAEVRALFLAEAARQLGCEAADLRVADGAILLHGAATGLDYWALAPGVDLDRPATGEARWKDPADYRLIGRSAPRLDLPDKVFGAGFIQDIRLPGMIHARVLRQPGNKARLVSMDEAAVRRAGGETLDILVEGDFVAFLSADETSARRALEAAELSAQWEGARSFSPALSEAASLKEMASAHFESAPAREPSNLRRHTATYSRPYTSHGSMGPSCGVALFQDGRLTLHTHAQGVFPMRLMAARITGLEPDAITVHHAQGAGNYGHNGSDDAAIDAAVIAMRRPGVPIRVQWRREDEFGYAPVGTAMHIELAAELDASGRIAHYSTEIWSGPHVGRGRGLAELALPHEETPPTPPNPQQAARMAMFSGGRLNAVPSYDLPDQRVQEHTVAPMPVRTSSLRGLGGPANIYAGECFVDELADLAGENPLTYRLAMLKDPRGRAVLERVAAMADWSRRWAPGTGRGLGISYSKHRDRGAMVGIVVECEVDQEVRLKHVWCAADCGLIINPDGARNQIDGGIIMAASWVLKEQVKLGPNGIESTTWDDYPILRFDEIPLIDTEFLEPHGAPAMGIGEVSSGDAMAAIGNAVAHALGARVRTLPYTRDRIAAALLST